MHEHKEDIIRITVTSVLLIALMIINKVFDLPGYISLVLYLIPYLIIGFEVLKEAVENIFHGEVLDECFLMGIATVGAFIIGEYAEAVFVMLFFCVGELFEHISTHKSKKAISELMDIRPDKANLITEKGISEISPEDVKPGDIILVKPGEKIPLDGIITEGGSSVNTAALTGESLPQDVAVNDTVLGGSINLSGLIKIRVTKPYCESSAARILRLIEEGNGNKAKAESFIKRFAKKYTPAVVISAALIAIIPSVITGNAGIWVYRALLLLILSCPCALVVSIPLSYFGGIGCASKKGILVKGSFAIENLSKIKTVIFDKTGTLTKGKFEVSGIYPENVTENQLLTLAAAVEKNSNHPISTSVLKAAENIKALPPAEDITELAGLGITAKVDNKSIFIGNEKLMKKYGFTFKSPQKTGTALHIVTDGVYAGHIIISDTVKEQSKPTVDTLKTLGIKTVMLTGDSRSVAENVAANIGIDEVYAELLPDIKVKKTAEIKKKTGNKAVFVGDGINDAPVLIEADIGISMGNIGSDAAVEAADIVIMDDDISKIPTAIEISRKTNRIVMQNIVFVMTIKIGVLLLSVFGFSNMWLSSFADVGTLVLSILNSTRTLSK